MKKLPVIILSGFLGARKETLLSHILNNKEGLKVALIVKDMAEINIDSQLISKKSLSQIDENLIELSNGCICYNLREDLFEGIQSLAKEDRFDYILVESTGISKSVPAAEPFEFEDEDGLSLKEVAILDTMVTVIDTFNFSNDFKSTEILTDREEFLSEEDERSISALIIEKVEYADVVILNKVFECSEEDKYRVEQIVRSLNADAKIIKTDYSKVDLKEIMNTGLFDFEKASNYPLGMKTMLGQESIEADELNVNSFTYQVRKPFHPERFYNVINEDIDEVIRSKGTVCLANINNYAMTMQVAGALGDYGLESKWLSAAMIDEPELADEYADYIQKSFVRPYGDRKQEIVFNDVHLDEKYLTNKLDYSLLTDEEYAQGAEVWKNYEDPFNFEKQIEQVIYAKEPDEGILTV